ncbi:MAG: NotI family restriction endonuclease [Pseudobdellovibrionaceae bacterium]
MAQRKVESLHPLAEVFGFKTVDKSAEAKKHRKGKLCPFHNGLPECTKDKKNNPLGVCSIYFNDIVAVICPVRFRENWRVCKDVADFFFPKGTKWSFLKEIRLKEKNGDSAGNIDLVLVAHDENGKIHDFGTVEVQAVYVSGNIRRPFEKYMEDPNRNGNMDWTEEEHYPRPDFLSSSRKRLAPQLLYKGQILQAWGKKQAVVIDRPFYDTLPDLPEVSEDKSDLCWLIYDLDDSKGNGRFKLELDKKLFTGFDDAMKKLANPDIGDVSDFVDSLEGKLKIEIESLKRNFGVTSFSELLEKQETESPEQNARPAELT